MAKVPIKTILQQTDPFSWLEGITLFIVTPFLLFPTVKIEITLLAFGLLILLWILPFLIPQWKRPPATPIDLILLFFVIMLFVGILVTADPDLTLPKTAVLILGLTLWHFLNRFITLHESVYLVTAVYILAAFSFIFLGILNAQWLFKIPILSNILTLLPTGLIALPESNLGVHANQLAGTTLYLFPLFLGIIFGLLSGRPSRKALLFWGTLFALSGFIILLTQSRTGWIATAGTLFLLTLCWALLLPKTHKRHRWVWGSVGLMLTAGVAGLAFIGPQRIRDIWQNPSQQTAIGNVGSIAFRQEVWRWAITTVQDFPFTGTGLGTFRRVVRRLYPLNFRPDYDISHAHNLFLQTALDIGLPGLITYLALILVTVFLLWHIAQQDQQLRPFALGFLGVIIAQHLFGLTDALALGSKTTVLFWIMLAIITAMHRLSLAQPLAKE